MSNERFWDWLLIIFTHKGKVANFRNVRDPKINFNGKRIKILYCANVLEVEQTRGFMRKCEPNFIKKNFKMIV